MTSLNMSRIMGLVHQKLLPGVLMHAYGFYMVTLLLEARGIEASLGAPASFSFDFCFCTGFFIV